MPAEDGRGSQRLASRSRSLDRGLGFDLVDQVESPFPPDLFRKMFPARERREVQGFGARIFETVEGFSTIAGGILLRPVEPESREVLDLDQRPGDVDTRPILRTSDKSFFATILETVPESPQLVKNGLR
jgi:hypothetical protein